MFRIIKKKFGEFELIGLVNENTEEYVIINPGFGAALHQMGLRKNDQVFSLLESYTSYENLLAEFSQTYKGAKLCPFPNMIKNGRYVFENNVYQLEKNWVEDGHAIHGFVADKPFKILEEGITESEAVVVVFYQHPGTEGYPFLFGLTIKYSLRHNGFTVTQGYKIQGKTQCLLVMDGIRISI